MQRWQGVMHGSNEAGGGGDEETTEVAGPAFLLEMGHSARAGARVFVILNVSGAARSVRLVGGVNAVVIVVSAMALVRLVLIVLLAMALARRFRDIGWPAWIGPTVLLVTVLGPPFLAVGYGIATYVNDIRNDIHEWVSMVGWISDSVNLALLIVAGSVPGKENIEVAQVFE